LRLHYVAEVSINALGEDFSLVAQPFAPSEEHENENDERVDHRKHLSVNDKVKNFPIPMDTDFNRGC
jgi:hypothetical protein